MLEVRQKVTALLDEIGVKKRLTTQITCRERTKITFEIRTALGTCRTPFLSESPPRSSAFDG